MADISSQFEGKSAGALKGGDFSDAIDIVSKAMETMGQIDLDNKQYNRIIKTKISLEEVSNKKLAEQIKNRKTAYGVVR